MVWGKSSGGEPLHERAGERVRVTASGDDVGHRLLLEGVPDHVVVDGVEGEVGNTGRHVGGGERGEVMLHVLDAGWAGELTQPERRGPRVPHERGAGVDGEGAHGDQRVVVGVRGGDLGGDCVDHQCEHLGLVGDVVVERHHLVAELGGELAHREGLGAALVGEGDRPGDDRVAIEGFTFVRGRTHP